MATTIDEQAELEQYRDLLISAFADFSGLDETEQHVGLSGARELLRAGGPLEPARIARVVNLPTSQVEEILRRHAEMGFVYFDNEGRVVGMWAVGGMDAGHSLEVEGRAAPTWCALDTLLLPIWWDTTARVTSRDALTGARISFSVGPAGIADLEPPAAVVSAYEPDGPVTSDVRASFCQFVNFFESPESAERWAKSQQGRRFRFLRVEVAFAWSRDYIRSIFRDKGAVGA
jgi:hypothetical protein